MGSWMKPTRRRRALVLGALALFIALFPVAVTGPILQVGDDGVRGGGRALTVVHAHEARAR